MHKEVDEGESVSWGGARTKYEGQKCRLTKNMIFHSDCLQLCLKKKGRSLSSFLTQLFLLLKNCFAN